MQDKDFDSLLKRKFEHQDLQQYQEGKWAALKDKLDAFDRKRNAQSKWVYALVIATLLLGNLAWLCYWLGNSSNRTSKPLEAVVKRDTLFQTIRVVRFDTIYRTIILENKFTGSDQPVNSGNTRPIGLSTKSSSSAFPPAITDALQISEIEREITSRQEIKDAGINPTTAASTAEAPILPAQSGNYKDMANVLSPLKTLKPESLPLNQRISTPLIPATNLISKEILQEQNPPQSEEPVEKKPSFHWQPMWVNGAQVLLFPGRLEGYVLHTGLQFERNLSNRIALGGSLRFGLAAAESSDITRLPSLDNTPPVQPGPAYTFDHWDVDFMPLIQYQIYGHLRIASLGKTRLMAGAGTQWISILPYHIDYQYFNPDRFEEKDVESEKNAETRWQGLNLLLQAERPLGNKAALGTRLNGMVPHRPLQTVLDQSLGLDFWLKFRL